jgi:transcriptional regulator with XRE-family HTH domain
LADETFGQRLRRERERRKISLASIAADTKIAATLLEGLENDDVSRWPAGIYRRSFVRAHAVAIGLDPDRTAREFLELYPDPIEVADAAIARTEAEHTAPAPDSRLRLKVGRLGTSFRRGRLLTSMIDRGAAVVCDLGVIVALGLSLFVVLGSFWMPLGVATLLYYAGGILLLGNTPGVCLFGPDVAESRSSQLATRQNVTAPQGV